MKKIIHNISVTALLATVLIMQSCKKDFVNINTNPNLLNSAAPEYLFTGTTSEFNDNSRDQLSTRYKFLVYMQYMVTDALGANLGTPYCNPTTTAGVDIGVSYYGDYFTGIGTNMHRIIAQINAMPEAQKATYANVSAICSVLDTYEAWRALDIYGAMPYRQAFDPFQYPTPVYDYDYTLYKLFDSTLKVAAATLQSNGANQMNLGAQDFFYGGDVPSWEAFANTLRIKIAQRFEKRDAANLASVVSDVANNFKGLIISSNAQSFGYNHTKTWNDNLDVINAIMTQYNAAYPFVEFLKSTKDPRLPLMIRQNDMGTNATNYNTVLATGDATAQAFLAQPANLVRYYGQHTFPQSNTDASYGLAWNGRFQTFNVSGGTTVKLDYTSLLQGRYFVKNGGFGGTQQGQSVSSHTDENTSQDPSTIPMRELWLTYGETCFMMAEIAQKSNASVMGQTATQWYNAGVQASFNQYQSVGKSINVPGADTVTIGDYLTRYPYNGTLQRIYSQEWVHLMVEPEESYALWKRTGYPSSVDWRPGQPTTTGNIGDGSGNAYIENIWNGSINLVAPRRGAFTKGNAGNSAGNDNNYNTAVTNMMTQNPAFGANVNDTKGRTWWDQQ